MSVWHRYIPYSLAASVEDSAMVGVSLAPHFLTDSPHIGKFLNALKCFLTVEEFQKDFGFAEFFVGYRLAMH